MLWNDAIKKYFDTYSPNYHVKDTQRCIRRDLGLFRESAAKTLGRDDFALSEIAQPHVLGFIGSLQDGKREPASINAKLRYVKSFLNWCVTSNFLNRNPFIGTKMLRVVKRSGAEKMIDESEMLKVLEHIRAAYEMEEERPRRMRKAVEDLAVVAYHTGIRLGEGLWLRIPDIDLERKLLHVRNRKEHLAKDREDRTIPLNGVALEVLRPRIQQAKDEGRAEGLLFTNTLRVRGPLDLTNVSHRFGRWCDEAGVPQGNFYALRHSFGTRMAQFYTPFELQKIMGHSDPSVTSKYYVHMDSLKLKAPPPGSSFQTPAPQGQRPLQPIATSSEDTAMAAPPQVETGDRERAGSRSISRPTAASTNAGRRRPMHPDPRRSAPRILSTPDPLRPAEVERLVVYLDRVRAVIYADLVRLVAHTGLRLTESLRLTAKDVDLKRRSVLVHPRAGSLHEEEAGRREVPLDEISFAIVERRCTAAADGPLFPSGWARLATRVKKFGELLAVKASSAGVPKANWQELREYFIWQAARRMEPQELGRILGISEASCVDRYYRGRGAREAR